MSDQQSLPRGSQRGVGVVTLAGLLLAILVAAVASTAGAGEATPAPETGGHWYRLEIGGQSAGWMVAREAVEGDRLVTETSMELTVARGGTEVQMEMAGRFVESLDGRAIEAWSRQVFGLQPIEATYFFADDHVRVHTRQGDRESEQERPALAGEWVPPGIAQARLRTALREGMQRFSVRSLDPLLGLQIVETAWLRVGAETTITTVPAGEFVTTRWQQRVSVTPGLVATVDLDAEGTMIASTTPFMGTTMSLVLATREYALAKVGAPELMMDSFIYPDRPIAHPRTLRRAVYRLRTEDGSAPTLPNLGVQQTTMATDSTSVVVDLDRAPGLAAKISEAALVPYLRTSIFLDHQAPAIRDLLGPARDALAQDADPAARAEALRLFVHRHLDEKNLDALLATAVEVAESRAGDCTEHSVLLAALLRADGIASRVVTGLIYVDRFVGATDLFAYHMWTQAYVGSRWVDLDATLQQPFDAAHIAIATSPLADDQTALVDLASIVALLGNLRIEVVEPSRPD